MSNIEILDYKPVNKGSLAGVCRVLIVSLAMEIRGITVWQKQGQQWFNFPSEAFETDEGKKAYNPWVKIANPTYHKAFQSSMRKELADYLMKNSGSHNEEVSG